MSAAGQRWLQRPRPLSQVASPTPGREVAARGRGHLCGSLGLSSHRDAVHVSMGTGSPWSFPLVPGGKFGVFVCTPTKCSHCVHAEMQHKVPAVTQG